MKPIVFFAFGLVMIAAACQRVGDVIVNVTAPEVSSVTCVRSCNEDFRASAAVETARHRVAMHGCRHDRQCRSTEFERHRAEMEWLRDERRKCKDACYNEGGGFAGR